MRTTKIMTEVANKHGYKTWNELLYDAFANLILESTTEVMKTTSVRFKEWCENGNAYFFDNNEQHTHTNEELFEIWNNQS